MLKLNASYSKKVPAEGEYTSQSYHASIEVELPDGLNSDQLNGKIHEIEEFIAILIFQHIGLKSDDLKACFKGQKEYSFVVEKILQWKEAK